MKICVDENIPLRTVAELRARGNDVLDIRGTARQGISDEQLWEMAQRESRLLITTDKGFVQHRNEAHHGILVIRLRQPNEQKIHTRALRAIEQSTENEWAGLLVVVRDTVQSIWRSI